MLDINTVYRTYQYSGARKCEYFDDLPVAITLGEYMYKFSPLVGRATKSWTGDEDGRRNITVFRGRTCGENCEIHAPFNPKSDADLDH